ncbi:MAG: trypsin-like peptidase domain-containing protein [Melioribacteraceae bacterium]|nr:trypsin-like peptidase domain-containing protein [Melioribacteraceae bacterium]MCF8356076.1 trypsin-like peptidase domain-containing protein [Melioribacteraceae bacterium]MCF8395531.1 trypsin-like peptidase domain-containing protein [Melioribacteraceae bacterium]MCF8420603.1 trypsin-like peptidase domain-containing protein [Melioribacteraceae bacterium]
MTHLKIIFLSSLTTLLIASTMFAFIYFKDSGNNQKADPDTTTVKDSSGVVLTSYQQNTNASDQIFTSRRNIITSTVSKASPAVVGISVTAIREYRDPFSMDPLFRYFFGDRVYKRQIKGLGSGAIISHDGYIITNDHVAGNGVEIIVTLTDGTQYEAEIVGTDPASDICLLKIDAKNLPHLKFGNSEEILIGEWVIALGNPFGLFDVNDKPTVTVGVISAVGMNLNAINNRHYINMIQTDASINTGNSGGPLVNSLGELIGINTLIFTAQGSSGSVGVGFAIPINKVKKIIAELKENGKVDRNFWTGLKIQPIDQKIADYFNLKNTRGVIITDIAKDSPAEKAGLEVGDVILKVDDNVVFNDETMVSILYEYKTGETIEMEVLRDEENFSTNMKLEKTK